MENLRLLEIHRRKVALLVALLIFLLLYTVIIVFQFSSAYFEEKNEDQQLVNKSVRVLSVVKNYDAITGSSDNGLEETVDSILKGTSVFSESRILSDNLQLDRKYLNKIEDNSINKINGWKIYKETYTENNESFTIVVGMDYKTILQKLSQNLLILFLLAPLIYSIFAWGACRFMKQIYNPLKEIIVSLEGFASNVNHEFKTSLTEIISSLELAKVTGDYKEANTHSIGSARRLDSILNSLGTMIHFVNSDYRRERVNIVKLLDTSLEDFEKMKTEKNIQIIKKYNPNSQIFKYIDASPLTLCFQNILENAIKYSDEGGEIEIYITRERFVIKDYGEGISNKNLEKIFDRYFREGYTKTGSGIGLSIIKKITEIYNWTIDVKSKKDKYTKVSLDF